MPHVDALPTPGISAVRARVTSLRSAVDSLPAFRGAEPQPADPGSATELARAGIRWARNLDAAMLAALEELFAPVNEAVLAWQERPQHPRRRALTSLLVLLALVTGAIAAPLVAGRSEEVLASVGERLFGVGPLPPISRPPERSTVLDADGNVLGLLTGPENRKVVALSQIPDVLVDAVVATEDARFFEHDGIDTRAIVRAAWSNVRGESVQGGSTITQQYVKNALLTSERSFERKVTEATWAVRLEQTITKPEILERYLNIVYLGDGNYGVAAGAEYWFGLPIDQVDLPRAALLAGMIQSPESLDPVTNPEGATAARNGVLTQMHQHGMITAAEAEAAKALDVASLLQVTPVPAPTQPRFVRSVVDVLLADERLGQTRADRAEVLFRGGLTITTTLDPRLQAAAEAAIAQYVTDPASEPMAGIVSVRPGDGAVPAMALGPHAFGPCADAGACTTTTVNPLMAGMGSAGRQVGSAFKPIVYAAALEQGLTTDWHTSTTSGRPIDHPACPDYAPENYDGDSAGTIDMPEALRRSTNVFAVKLGLATGLENVTATAEALGIPGLPPYCSVALGSIESHPLQLAAAYAAFAADGRWCAPYLVTEVRDPAGEVLLRQTPRCRQAVSVQTARAMATMLHENAVRGTATRAAIDRPIAAKTGTTDDFRDAWLVGWTPQLATAVWVGYEHPQPMTSMMGFRNVAGGTVPAMLWSAYMGPAMAGLDVLDLALVELARYRACRGDVDSFAEGTQRCRRIVPKPPDKPAKPDEPKPGKDDDD